MTLSPVPFASALLVSLAGSAVGQGAAPAASSDLLQSLLPSATAEARAEALVEIAEAGDETFVAPLLDLLVLADTPEEWYSALDALSPLVGEETRELDGPWRTLTRRRLKASPVDLPLGYGAFKGELLAQEVDPLFRRFLGPKAATSIRLDEVQWGGVKVDGIPALDDPKIMTAAEATFLADDAPVFGIVLNGEARAYPNQILDWHEMANDQLGGVPIALTWCTLCGAPLVYRATRGEGEPRLTFGSSGLLYRSNKLMYDRATDTLWNQITGRPVIGARVERGDVAPLEILNVRTTTWGAWRADYPETTTVSPATGIERDYRVGAAYGEYFASSDTMFPTPITSKRYLPKERIMVAYLGGRPWSTSIKELRDAQVVHLGPADAGLLLVSLEPRARPPADGKLHPMHDALAFATGARKFKATESPRKVVDAQGEEWDVTDTGLVHPSLGRCERVPSHPAFGFAWDAHLNPRESAGLKR